MTTTEHINYKFKVGDKVITTFGEVGEITSICDCKSCKIRGFYEPCWVDEYGEEHYITIWDAKSGFDGFYQIGEYKFNSLFNKNYVTREIVDRELELLKWRKRLRVITIMTAKEYTEEMRKKLLEEEWEA